MPEALLGLSCLVCGLLFFLLPVAVAVYIASKETRRLSNLDRLSRQNAPLNATEQFEAARWRAQVNNFRRYRAVYVAITLLLLAPMFCFCGWIVLGALIAP